MLKENMSITHIDLRFNPDIGDEGALAIIESIEQNNGAVYEVRMSWCNVSLPLFERMSRVLRRNRWALQMKMVLWWGWKQVDVNEIQNIAEKADILNAAPSSEEENEGWDPSVAAERGWGTWSWAEGKSSWGGGDWMSMSPPQTAGGSGTASNSNSVEVSGAPPGTWGETKSSGSTNESKKWEFRRLKSLGKLGPKPLTKEMVELLVQIKKRDTARWDESFYYTYVQEFLRELD